MTASDVGHDTERPAGRMFVGPAGRLAGEPDRRAPLILLHKGTFGRTMWRPVLAELRTLDPGRRVFTVDLPGHGRPAAWAAGDIEGMTEGVHRAAEAAELRSPVVVGHCAAAMIATVYAARYPARGVINVAAQCLRIEPGAGLARSLAALRAARVPYLVIAGHELEPGYQDCLDRMLPQASVTIWPGSGAFPHLAHPTRFARCLAATAWWGPARGVRIVRG
jgi:pimeloyl-ACP methyl ester carboxylesterase